MRPLAQFQILNQRTGHTEVYFKTQIKDLKLQQDVYGKPGDESGNGTWTCNIFSPSQEEPDDMVKALRSIGIDFRPGTPFDLPEPRKPVGEGRDDNSLPVIIEGDLSHRKMLCRIDRWDEKSLDYDRNRNADEPETTRSHQTSFLEEIEIRVIK